MSEQDAKKVGYGRPPETSQFRKGQSGNPAGRAKGQRNLKTDLKAELAEVISLNEGGQPIRLTRRRALLKSLTARAISGDNKATELILKLMGQLFQEDKEAAATAPFTADDQLLLDTYFNRRTKTKAEAS